MREPTRHILVLLALLSVLAGLASAPAVPRSEAARSCIALILPASVARPLANSPRPAATLAVDNDQGLPSCGHQVRHRSRGPPSA